MRDFLKRRSVWLVALTLGLGTLFLYSSVRTFEFVQQDDPDYITQNPVVQKGLTVQGFLWAFQSVHASNWHPLTWLSHMLDVELFGMDPAGHHVVNLLFHCANTLLIFFVMKRMTGALWKSALLAALFAWHPLRVESVVWVSERKDVLSTFFWWAAIWAYVGYVELKSAPQKVGRVTPCAPLSDSKSRNSSAQRERRARSDAPYLSLTYYSLALIFFALGLLSKPMLVTLPFVLLLLDYWPLQRFRFAEIKSKHSSGRNNLDWSVTLKLLREKWPLFVLSAALCVATFYAQKQGGAVVPIDQLPFGLRISNAFISFARYIGKTFWPVDLSSRYPYDETPDSLLVSAAILFVLAASIAAIFARRRWPYILVGWFWFVGTLVPVIGLIQVGGQSMADRYMYIPGVGLSVLFIWGVSDLVNHWRKVRIFFATAAGVAVIALAVVAHSQIKHWRNNETLFRQAIKATPDNFSAHNNLAVVLAQQGRLDESKDLYLKALRINPNYAEAHYNLGVIFGGKGNCQDAISHYREAVRLNPNHVDALSNLAWVLGSCPEAEFRNGAEAVSLAERAAGLAQPSEILLRTLDIAYAEDGQFEKAIAVAENLRLQCLAAGYADLAQFAEKRLELYRAGKPYRHDR